MFLIAGCISNDTTEVEIIADNGIAFREGPGPEYDYHPSCPRLERGTQVYLLSEKGDWWEVKTESGNIGWIRYNIDGYITAIESGEGSAYNDTEDVNWIPDFSYIFYIIKNLPSILTGIDIVIGIVDIVLGFKKREMYLILAGSICMLTAQSWANILPAWLSLIFSLAALIVGFHAMLKYTILKTLGPGRF